MIKASAKNTARKTRNTRNAGKRPAPTDGPKPGNQENTFRARIIANFGEAAAISPIEDDASHAATVTRATPLKKVPLLVAGDIVVCNTKASHERDYRIVQLESRHSELARPDRRGKLKPVAANVSRLLIVCAPQPLPDTLLIDQFCVVALNNGFEPVVVLNKSDLLTLPAHEAAAVECREILAAYTRAGIETLCVNTKEPEQISPLLAAIENQVAALVGQSGVGKSSIIQKILPDQDIRVGAVSKATGIGAHTTTVSFWYELDNSGALIDSPGVRQFSVDYLDAAAVVKGYPEIMNLAQHCRFHNCTHRVEPDCAVRESLDSDKPAVSQLRYRNFLKLLEESEESGN